MSEAAPIEQSALTPKAAKTDPLRARGHVVPPATATLAMWIFLSALMMLFAASMVGYVVIRLQNPNAPGWCAIDLPGVLWLSTLVILASSWTLQKSVWAVKRQKLGSMRAWLYVTAALSALFVIVQLPAMASLVRDHWVALDESGMPIYGLAFFLILVHALHVVGGLVALVMVVVGARQNKYDHEHYGGIKHTAMYWHFLDVVWVVMFGTMLLMG